MTKEQLESNIAALRAWQSGKPIQCQLVDRPEEQWADFPSTPTWNLYAFQYRPKPEPKLRPWTQDEVPIGAEIKRKGCTGARAIIIAASDTAVFTHLGRVTFAEVMNHFTLADGSACGVEE